MSIRTIEQVGKLLIDANDLVMSIKPDEIELLGRHYDRLHAKGYRSACIHSQYLSAFMLYRDKLESIGKYVPEDNNETIDNKKKGKK